MSEAFITGSHAYGVPRPDSDIDLVVMLSTKDRITLAQQCPGLTQEECENYADPEDSGQSLRFGKLNLIIPPSQASFEAWRAATEALEARRPVAREDACDAIKAALSKAKVAT